jgi:hypothetical protein
LYKWIVTNNWAFEDTRNIWKHICGKCESVWYKNKQDPDTNNFNFYTSKDGTNWKEHKDRISAYEDVKCRCTTKCDECNDKMYENIVTNNWALQDTRNNWKDICGDCESVWYKNERIGDTNNFNPYTSKDGTNWKEHKDRIFAYEDVKCSRCTTNPPTSSQA